MPLQYIEFLRTALSTTQYAAMLPPLKDLLGRYALDPEIAFALYRPVLCHVAPAQMASLPEEGEIGEAMPGSEPAAAGEGKSCSQSGQAFTTYSIKCSKP